MKHLNFTLSVIAVVFFVFAITYSLFLNHRSLVLIFFVCLLLNVIIAYREYGKSFGKHNRR